MSNKRKTDRRTELVNTFVDKLKLINNAVDDDYINNFTGCVSHYGHNVVPNEAGSLVIIVRDTNVEFNNEIAASHDQDLELNISFGYVATKGQFEEDVRNKLISLYGDVLTCVGKNELKYNNDYGVGFKAERVYDFDISDTPKLYGECTLQLTMNFRNDKWLYDFAA